MNKGIVVAEQPDAVEVEARILIAGGNAVDAAIACAFATDELVAIHTDLT